MFCCVLVKCVGFGRILFQARWYAPNLTTNLQSLLCIMQNNTVSTHPAGLHLARGWDIFPGCPSVTAVPSIFLRQ